MAGAVWPGDCLELSLVYVREHALTLGIANITVCCFLVSADSPTVNKTLEIKYP